MLARLLVRAAPLLCLCAVAQAQSSLQVLDYGAEPRTPIRYHFTAGQSERASMEMAMSMTSEQDGKVMPAVAMPPTRTTLTVHVTSVAADGSAQLQFETHSAEATGPAGTPAEQAILDKSLATQSQLSGSYRTDTRGKIMDAAAKLPEGALPPGMPSQMLDDLMGSNSDTVQEFPEEALGPGARWQVVQHHNVLGTDLNMTEEFTLRSRSGNRIELDVKTTMPAPAPPAGAPAGMSVSGGTAASGKEIVDLDKLIPTMTMETSSSQTMAVPSKDKPQTIKMVMQMRMSVAPATE